MDFKTRKGVRTIGIIGLLVLAAIGFMLVIQPLMTQSNTFATERTLADSEMETAQQKIVGLQQQKDSIEAVEDLDAELSEVFPGAADAPSLIAYIQEAANKAGLPNDSVSALTVGVPALVASAPGSAALPADPATGAPVDPAAPADGAAATDPTATGDVVAAPTPDAPNSSSLAEVPIEISVTGSSQQIADFMTNLSNSKRNLDILTYSISEEGEGNEATASISLNTYIYRSILTPEEQATVAPALAEDAAPVDGSAVPVTP